MGVHEAGDDHGLLEVARSPSGRHVDDHALLETDAAVLDRRPVDGQHPVGGKLRHSVAVAVFGSPAALEEPGKGDGDQVERDQRDHLEQRRHRIDARKGDRDRRHGDDPDPPVSPQLGRREHADPDEAEHEQRHLEDDRDRHQHERDEGVVVLRPDLDVVEVVVVAGQVLERRGQDDVVPEGDAGDRQRSCERNEPPHAALCSVVERRREERPDLPEDDRQRDQERGVERHRHRGQERLGDPERDRMALRCR